MANTSNKEALERMRAKKAAQSGGKAQPLNPVPRGGVQAGASPVKPAAPKKKKKKKKEIYDPEANYIPVSEVVPDEKVVEGFEQAEMRPEIVTGYARVPKNSTDVFWRIKNSSEDQLRLMRQSGDAEITEDVTRDVVTGIIESDRRLAQLPPRVKEALIQASVDEILYLGPIEPLLADTDITEVMVNGPDDVWVEVRGRLKKTDVEFRDDEHIRLMIERIVSLDNRRCDESSPLCDCSLHRKGAVFDGSRVNCVVPPIGVDHPAIDIRKFREDSITVPQLIANGTMDIKMAEFLRAIVQGRMNIVVMGGTGSGKTTLLNALSTFIQADQRIITIEDTAELHLHQPHIYRMEARQANAEGVGGVSIRRLVVNALRQRPDRIVVGECRGEEAFDMIQAMSTGHDGSLTTIHANNTRATVDRMQSMIQMAGFDMPASAIRKMIADAVDFIVNIRRYPDGSRKVAEICEICGLEGEQVTFEPIMKFEQEEWDPHGKVEGKFVSTGARPTMQHMQRLVSNGIEVKDDWFEVWSA